MRRRVVFGVGGRQVAFLGEGYRHGSGDSHEIQLVGGAVDAGSREVVALAEGVALGPERPVGEFLPDMVAAHLGRYRDDLAGGREGAARKDA